MSELQVPDKKSKRSKMGVGKHMNGKEQNIEELCYLRKADVSESNQVGERYSDYQGNLKFMKLTRQKTWLILRSRTGKRPPNWRVLVTAGYQRCLGCNFTPVKLCPKKFHQILSVVL